jgi:Virulence factor membrane-bound polymerase, C-terminal/O-Antigen ligase/Protein glycosylation ligase
VTISTSAFDTAIQRLPESPATPVRVGPDSLYVALLALPWLIPFTFGPAPWVLQSVLCGAVLVLLWWLRSRPGRFQTSAPISALLAHSLLWAAGLSSVMAVIQVAGWAPIFSPWVADASGVAYANLRQRNQFASLTVLGLAALVWTLRDPQPGDRRRLWVYGLKASVVVLVLGLLMVGNAASASRTGLVGVAMVCALGWLWRAGLPPLAKLSLWLALPLYGLATLALRVRGWVDATALARLAQGDEPCSSRTTLWSNVLDLIAQEPWGGWGWGDLAYAHFMARYPDTRFCAILDNAHNLPLHVAVTLGVPIALALCTLVLGWVLWQKPWQERVAARQLAWCALAALMLHSMLEYPLWYGPFQLVALLCLAVLLKSRGELGLGAAATGVWAAGGAVHSAISRWQESHMSSSLFADSLQSNFTPKIARLKTSYRHVINGFIAIILFSTLSYIAWDYYRVSQIFLPAAQRSSFYQGDIFPQLKRSRLFAGHVQFAELTTTPLTTANASDLNELAKTVLHFSPEAVVVQTVVESAVMMGQPKDALFYLERFQAAYPAEHRAWSDKLHSAVTTLPK